MVGSHDIVPQEHIAHELSMVSERGMELHDDFGGAVLAWGGVVVATHNHVLEEGYL